MLSPQDRCCGASASSKHHKRWYEGCSTNSNCLMRGCWNTRHILLCVALRLKITNFACHGGFPSHLDMQGYRWNITLQLTWNTKRKWERNKFKRIGREEKIRGLEQRLNEWERESKRRSTKKESRSCIMRQNSLRNSSFGSIAVLLSSCKTRMGRKQIYSNKTAFQSRYSHRRLHG